MSMDNRVGHRPSGTMANLPSPSPSFSSTHSPSLALSLPLYLSLSFPLSISSLHAVRVGSPWGQQRASGGRGGPLPGKGWALSPCSHPGKPLCLRADPWRRDAGLPLPAAKVSVGVDESTPRTEMSPSLGGRRRAAPFMEKFTIMIILTFLSQKKHFVTENLEISPYKKTQNVQIESVEIENNVQIRIQLK